MRLYYFIGGLLGPFAGIALHIYGRLTGTPRARVVARNENNEILLVQSSLSRGRWGLPGGGIGRNESAQEAGLRELSEETGITAEITEVSYLFSLPTASHEEVVFSLMLPKSALPELLPNRLEIQAAGWFSPQSLPELETSAGKILAEVAKIP